MNIPFFRDPLTGVSPHPAKAPVSVDFETYYDKQISIVKLGTHNYCYHPQFRAYLVAIYADGGELQYVGPLKDAPWDAINGRTWWSHNANFDALVFHVEQSKGRIPAHIAPASWDCTADLAAYFQSPRSLDVVSRELLGESIEKDTRTWMLGKTYEDARIAGKLDELHQYALTGDARVCYKLASTWGKEWPESEILISRLNRQSGFRGVPIDRELLVTSIKNLEHALWDAEQHIPWDWDKAKTPLSPKQVRDLCRKEQIPCPTSFAADSTEYLEWVETYAADYPWIRARSFWHRGNILLNRLKTIQSRLTANGTFPFSIKYFGTHTGRFSGSDGFNMQNMPRRSFELGQDMPSIDLRAVFRAQPGHKLAVVDLSQIEPRILLSLAQDTKQLDMVRKGMDIYEAHARKTMGYNNPIPLAEAAETDSDIATLQRLAKARVLGLGYGCGNNTFQKVAYAMARLTVTPPESKAIVTAYRRGNPGITQLWNYHQRMMERHALRGTTYSLTLPSGRLLNYRDVHFTDGKLRARLLRGGPFHTFFGGKIVENFVQAIARDVFVHGLIEANKRGHNLLWHIHDEGVWDTTLDTELDSLQDALAKSPDWFPDLPLASKGLLTVPYVKG